jgi:hypothetical protein
MMFLDAVLSDVGKILYNDAPKAVETWLREHYDDVELVDAHVISGFNLARYTVNEYLENARSKA